MRLSERKIDYLSGMIFDVLKNSKFCVLERAQGPVVEEIKNAITEDLTTEDEIEEEARRILDEHDEESDRVGLPKKYEQRLLMPSACDCYASVVSPICFAIR